MKPILDVFDELSIDQPDQIYRQLVKADSLLICMKNVGKTLWL